VLACGPSLTARPECEDNTTYDDDDDDELLMELAWEEEMAAKTKRLYGM